MYQNYFGFKERPFQLVPNPAYLFLSPSHEEAMAHLTYATSQGDGFVVVTGEVGTGKTTLCRAFIESLDDNTEVAYIFNPKLTAVELLQTVCDEFDIDSGAETIKALVDRLNAFLMKQKSLGRRVLLIIDEAQNLNHEVLEQVRLLSNIETNTEKLLQIILVGQPEMGEVLDSYELRQLGQRITLSCHISPLNYKETCQYIQHRIRIAARNEGVPFTNAALKKIYAYSLGIPRLIHIVCDRALLTAYGLEKQKITGDVVQSAIQELCVRGDIRKLRFIEKRKTIILSTLLCAVLVLLFVFKPQTIDMKRAVKAVEAFKLNLPEIRNKEPNLPEIKKKKAAPADGVNASTRTNKISVTPAPPSRPPALRFPSVYGPPKSLLVTALRTTNTNETMKTAISQVLSVWDLDVPVKHYDKKKIVDDETFFTLTARENGFLIQKVEGNFNIIKRLALPAMIGFNVPGNLRPKYLALSAFDESTFVFLTPDSSRRIEMPQEQLLKLWSGVAFVPWKNFWEYWGTTPISGPPESTLILKKLLRRIGYTDLDETSTFDAKTKAAVKKIQAAHGLTADGFVGPLTKIILYSKQPDLAVPHIRSKEPGTL